MSGHAGTLCACPSQYRWRAMQRVIMFLRPVHVAALAALVVLAGAVAGVVGTPSIVSAHTDIDYTLPADGEQAAAPVEEITVAFNDPVTLVGAGFEVLTPAGDVVVPSVFSEDGAVYFLEVVDPLAGGVAAVRYQVAAADGHVLEGGFSFTVPAAPATTAPAVTVPATAAPATSGGAAATAAVPTTAPSVIAPAPTTAPPTATPVATVPTSAVDAVDGGGEGDGGGGSGILIIGVVAAVAIAGVAFLLLRSRTSTQT